MAGDEHDTGALKRTPLHGLHLELGAKMVPFAGYDMPVQYPMGVKAEHLHTRAQAGLFDVSHMGQVRLRGDDVAAALEALVPGDIRILKPGRMRYTVLTTATGGIVDDLMVTNMGDHHHLVLNAARRSVDLAHIRAHMPGAWELDELDDHALLALQGPAAAAIMAGYDGDCATMPFMTARTTAIDGIAVQVSRSGYTGEDGFELSVAGADAEPLARLLLAHEEVAPNGLGARDSLRLEAGLCLYGNDIDETTTPVEAGLAWVINKRRRAEGGFLGAEVVLGQLRDGTARKRVGIRPDGRAPARAGTEIADATGAPVGEVTSGGYGPSVEGPICMGYVASPFAETGTAVDLLVRGTPRPARVCDTPFFPHRFYRG